jgi:succinate dehydrogenase / fumarate reductase cytochrome b subunit
MFSSSIGQKLLMAITGLFLITFLIVHCGINALVFFNDGGESFNKGAEFMGTNPLIRTMEIVLFIGLILHIVKGFSLWKQNNNARPIKYAVQNGAANSKWYSRSMGILGTLLLMFLIIHLRHFWVISRFTDEITSGKETLFNEMKEVFEHLWVVVLYVLAMVSLAYHLMHGFQSAFQTLGLNHKKYTPMIKSVGFWFSIIIPFIFAMMPIAMHFEIIK